MKNLKPFIEWIKHHYWFASGLIVIILAGLAYLPMISKLGIYRDDWDIIFGGIVWGPVRFLDMFSIDRPLIGIQYYFLYKLFGGKILFWHLWTFFIRVFSGLFFHLLIRRLWPTKVVPGLVMTSLFIIYPGFLQQADAITYISIITVLACVQLSLLFTVLTIQVDRTWLKVVFLSLALISTGYYLLLVEYVIGIEILRFAIIIYLLVVRRKSLPSVRKWKQAVLTYLPFLVGILLFLGWRFFFFQSSRPAVNVDSVLGQYLRTPVYSFLSATVTALVDALEITISAWFVPFYNLSDQVRLKQFLFASAFGLLAGGIVALCLYFSKREERITNEFDQDNNWEKYAIWIGGVGLLASILPVTISGREVMFKSILTVAFDRYSLHALPSAILLLGGILFSGMRRQARTFLVVVLVSLGITTQVIAGTLFANAWENNRQFWWQMSWRVPQIQPDTMLLANYASDTVIIEEYHVSYPGTLIYYPGSKTIKIGSSPLLRYTAEKVITGVSEDTTRRKVPIHSDFGKVLIAHFPTTTSCLHLVDGELPLLSPGSDPLVQMIAPFSKIDLIEVDAEVHTPPAEIFGSEPAHSWCYYYQSASLAVQRAEWERVVSIEFEAQALDLKPVDPSEWVPFLYAYVNLEDYENAKRIMSYFKDIDYLQHQVCVSLEKVEIGRLIESIEGIDFVRSNLCQW